MTLKEKAVLNPAYHKRGVGEFKYSNFDIARPVEYSLFIPRGKEFGAWNLGFERVIARSLYER